LTAEEEDEFNFACSVDEDGVGEEERLRNEGEPGGEVGEVICRVLSVCQCGIIVSESMVKYIVNLSE